MNDRLEKINAKLEALTFKNGKSIVLLDFIKTNFSDTLQDAVSPPFDPDMAMAKFVKNDECEAMFYLFKKDLLEISIFINGYLTSKKFKTSNTDEMREFLLKATI